MLLVVDATEVDEMKSLENKMGIKQVCTEKDLFLSYLVSFDFV